MAGGEGDLNMFHLYSRLPVELQYKIVRHAFDSAFLDLDSFAYSEYSILDRVWQEVIEDETFSELAISPATRNLEFRCRPCTI